MSKKKSFVRSILSAAILTQTLVTGVASAEQLPPDEYASPKPGEQHPSTLPPQESSIPSTGPLEYKVDHDRWYGNSYWGGGYRYYENVRAPSLSFQSVNLDVQARARLFEKQYTGFEVSTGTWNPSDSSRASRLNVTIANQEVFAKNDSSSVPFSTTTASYAPAAFDKEVFSASRTYGLGPIGVKVTGKVKAKASVNLTARAYRTSATTSGATFTGTSSAALYGSLSAGADVWLASAGVRGNVEFVKVTADKSAKSERNGDYINYDTRLTGQLCTLRGDVEIYGSLFGFSGEKTILDWDGYCFSRNWGAGAGSIYMGPSRRFPIFELPVLEVAQR